MDELGFPVEVVSGVPVVTTPGEPGGRQRADGPPQGSTQGRLAAERGTSGPDGQAR
jgi:hypothetical protein